jgi:transposase InsO family protein
MVGNEEANLEEKRPMSESKAPRWQDWARFRFSVIGALLSSPPGNGDLRHELDVLSAKSYRHPFIPDKQIRPGYSTIERWYYQAKEAADPVAALGRKIRVDSGVRKVISDELKAAIKLQYDDGKHWSVQLHYDNLLAHALKDPKFPFIPSYKSVLRCMRENGWSKTNGSSHLTDGQIKAEQRKERREIKGYEASHVHALWHLDFHHAKIKLLDASGAWQQPIVLAIIDDRSRLCCHLQFYMAETAECLIHGLTQAFMKRGLPRALMTDNGAAMVAEETREGLARLGIVHETTLPYSPYQNGKQEVFWGQLEGRLIALLKGIDDLNLSWINKAAQAWVEQDYHRTLHSEIKTTPLQRMLDGPDVKRPVPAPESMRMAFTRQIVRNPRHSDSTVVVEGVRFELPQRFSHMKTITLRFPGWNKGRMMVVDPKTGGPLAQLFPQDKTKNAAGFRKTIVKPENEEMNSAPRQKKEPPALLQKWIEEYSASGLPTGYMPKEELTHE